MTPRYGARVAEVDVLSALQTALDDPGSEKSGEYLKDHVLEVVRRAMATGDRSGVIAALRVWLCLRKDPQTMLAVTAAETAQLVELVADIEALQEDVRAGRLFRTYYLRWIEAALTALGRATC